ncbi:Hypothetical predicted protein [Octopus vulgaris]|uniref:Uncharacterized protein n=1 Tax=Octopus vulgaris TaxID=6645 RepID=A0AA36AIJ2_OCTVU|nr:Hypothetical predicted protein [Octopus vulgaris]
MLSPLHVLSVLHLVAAAVADIIVGVGAAGVGIAGGGSGVGNAITTAAGDGTGLVSAAIIGAVRAAIGKASVDGNAADIVSNAAVRGWGLGGNYLKFC